MDQQEGQGGLFWQPSLAGLLPASGLLAGSRTTTQSTLKHFLTISTRAGSQGQACISEEPVPPGSFPPGQVTSTNPKANMLDYLGQKCELSATMSWAATAAPRSHTDLVAVVQHQQWQG